MDFDLMSVDIQQESFPSIEACVLSPSGGGKSHIIGTLKGKVLYINGPDEKHGGTSAKDAAIKTNGCEVVAFNWAVHPTTGEDLTADQSLELIEQLLNPEFINAKGFTGVAIDSSTSLEKLVRSSTMWRMGCKTKDGSHNNFAEGPVAQELIDRIFNKIRALQRGRQFDFVITCIVDIKDMDEKTGEFLTARPKLGTYGLAEGCIQQFPHVLLVGPVLFDTKGKKEQHHVLQFNSKISRVQTNQDGSAKRYLNFTPRIIGAKKPYGQYVKADLEEVRKLLIEG